MHYHQFLILTDFGQTPLGKVVVGVPEDQILELRQRFPDHEVRGGDRQTQNAVKDNITEDEKGRLLAAMKSFSHQPVKLQLFSVPPKDGPPSEPALFESNGRLFWLRS